VEKNADLDVEEGEADEGHSSKAKMHCPLATLVKETMSLRVLRGIIPYAARTGVRRDKILRWEELMV
jgi:hypothetical protein